LICRLRGKASFSADDGEEIRVQVNGHGPAIALPTSGLNHRVWAPIAHRLCHRFTVYHWDARGHYGGHSEAPPPASGRPVSIERMSNDLRNLLHHFRLHCLVVVGHSMGALTIWAYIARHGCERLGRIGIIDQSSRLITDADWRLDIAIGAKRVNKPSLLPCGRTSSPP
jgi:pimeloyl-ACP methyl ester carboxylesterase